MRSSMRYAIAAMVVTGASAMVASWPSTRFDVTAVSASAGPVVREIVARSTLQAAATVDVAANVSGEIQSLELEERSIVRAGDILARIDPSPFEETLREARANLAYLRGQAESPIPDPEATPARTAAADPSARAAQHVLQDRKSTRLNSSH